MYTAKILEVKQDSYPNGESFLDVEIGVFNGDKQVDVRKFAKDVEASDKEIKADVKKFINLYNKEAEMAKEEAKKVAKQKELDKKINKLKGEEIS